METVPGLNRFTILYATDPHGSESAYERLFKEAVHSAANAVVLGGDLTPHSDPRGQGLFLREWLRPALARFRERNPAIRVFGLLGNDDWIANLTDFIALERDELLFGLHRQCHVLAPDLWIAGCSFVPVTPFGISDWDRLDSRDSIPPPKRRGPLFSDTGKIVSGSMDEIRKRTTVEDTLAEIATLSPPEKTVYVIHTPPHGTKLDMMYDGIHIGSSAVRRFIEKHQPPLTLHGHIHESPSLSGEIADHLGRTTMLNPGDSREKLRAVAINISPRTGSISWTAAE